MPGAFRTLSLLMGCRAFKGAAELDDLANKGRAANEPATATSNDFRELGTLLTSIFSRFRGYECVKICFNSWRLRYKLILSYVTLLNSLNLND